MKLFQAYMHLLIFLALTITSPAVPKYAKSWCSDKCGNVTIPFPFGIGADCSINKWYTVVCNSSGPYLSELNLEVLEVKLEDQTVTVNTTTISYCPDPAQTSSNITSIDLGSSPFWFSGQNNRFVFEGSCGNATMMNNGKVVKRCSTSCQNNKTVSETTKGYFGANRCKKKTNRRFKSYSINQTSWGRDEGCGYGMLVDEESYGTGNSSVASVPISLIWTLTSNETENCCQGSFFRYRMFDTSVFSRECYLSFPYTGNPYLRDGCKVTKECARCPNPANSCRYNITYDDEGSRNYTNFTCDYYPQLKSGSESSMGVILGVSISLGVLLLVATSYALYKWIKKTKERKQRKRFFRRNGGIVLKQQQEADPSLVGKTILFTSRDLKKATDNFNENRILGRGGQGTVYKGMLVDGRIVAIKKSKVVDESQLEHFINEVVILSQVNHRNVVKLLGCCLETDVPLLVYEFIPNGTLYDRLHKKTIEFPISLNMRLQFATEVAGALTYLHSAASIPIYHRDIKTTNILLDEKYRAKISDFGTSRFVLAEKTHLTTEVRGTFGYLDPEYFQSSQFTEKSDVYSFGVVLVEMLTRERAISLTRFGETRSLATHFMLAVEEGRVMSIFDVVVIKEGTRDELLSLANLAMRCLNLNGKYRPTMKEVAIELENIRTTHIPSTVQTNTGPAMCEEEDLMLAYGESSSTFLSFNDSTTLFEKM
ncbi:wall-associated receptor kinase-like 2 [Bidens hawaiensis]|uniref:wall-associated receptor kinase-like 2 n=1 Tax=Bidens hawaiensis TaxID=980011 RepID=UPI004049833D